MTLAVAIVFALAAGAAAWLGLRKGGGIARRPAIVWPFEHEEVLAGLIAAEAFRSVEGRTVLRAWSARSNVVQESTS